MMASNEQTRPSPLLAFGDWPPNQHPSPTAFLLALLQQQQLATASNNVTPSTSSTSAVVSPVPPGDDEKERNLGLLSNRLVRTLAEAVGGGNNEQDDSSYGKKMKTSSGDVNEDSIDVVESLSSLSASSSPSSPVPESSNLLLIPAEVQEGAVVENDQKLPLSADFPTSMLNLTQSNGNGPHNNGFHHQHQHAIDRITADCVVCGDKSSGKHYGQFTCEGCKSFFKRSVRRNLVYTCRGQQNCIIDQHHRNQCQFCRFSKCIGSGMKKEAVQRGRSSSNAGFVNSATFGTFFTTIAHQQQQQFQNQNNIAPGMLPHPQLQRLQSQLASRVGGNLLAANSAAAMAILNAAFSGNNSKNFHNNRSLAEMGGNLSAASQLLSLLLHAEQQINIFASQYASSPSLVGLNSIQEIAARLLFIVVDWAKNVVNNNNIFCSLMQAADFCRLLKAGWADIWIISAAQWPWALSALSQLASTAASMMPSPTEESAAAMEKIMATKPETTTDNGQQFVTEQIQLICRQVEKIQSLGLDSAEFTCLKALALLNSDVPGLANVNLVDALQEKVASALDEYERAKATSIAAAVSATSPNHALPLHVIAASRFPRLVLRVNILRSTIRPNIVEQLFFARLVGNVGIETLIDDMIVSKSPSVPPQSSSSEALPVAASVSNDSINGNSATSTYNNHHQNGNQQQQSIPETTMVEASPAGVHVLFPAPVFVSSSSPQSFIVPTRTTSSAQTDYSP